MLGDCPRPPNNCGVTTRTSARNRMKEFIPVIMRSLAFFCVFVSSWFLLQIRNCLRER
jgi:hypothetical protein